MKTIKTKSHYQAIWRANLYIKNGTKPAWQHLDDVKIERIRDLRRAGNTLLYIKKIANRSLKTICKYTSDIDVKFNKNFI